MPAEISSPPSLTDLLTRLLNKQADAHGAGLLNLGAAAEMTPYDAGSVQAVDAKAAWEAAVAALAYYQAGATVANSQTPPHWASLVAAHEPVVAIPFCLGSYPQLMRDFHRVIHQTAGTELVPSSGRPLPAPALLDWAGQAAAKKQVAQMLLALGCLRLASHFDEAERYRKDHDASIPNEWRTGWDNEAAALAWYQGHSDEARTKWHTLALSVPVLFNRGMAELFAGDKAKGRTLLSEVIAQLPEKSAWHHLAKVYLLLRP